VVCITDFCDWEEKQMPNFNIHVIWGLILLLVIILWMLIQISPQLRDRFDEQKEAFEKWWAIDNDVEQEHLRNGSHFQHLTDDTRARRHCEPFLTNIPSRASVHPNDPNCYFHEGREFCV
jgi:hypothetical protein